MPQLVPRRERKPSRHFNCINRRLDGVEPGCPVSLSPFLSGLRSADKHSSIFMAGTITMVSKVRDGVKTHGAAQLVITRKVIALRPCALIALESRILFASRV